MMHTFATREEAAVFASAMRSEGRYAEILDEGMGAIYGPLAIGGIRVFVSDEAVDHAENPEEPKNVSSNKSTAIDEFLNVVRMVVVSLAACGLITGMVIIIKTIRIDPSFAQKVLYPVLHYILVIGVLFAIMGPFMGTFTRWLRGDCSSVFTRAIRWLFLSLACLFILLLLL